MIELVYKFDEKSTVSVFQTFWGGHIHIIGRAKRAPHWGVQSRFCVDDICLSCSKMLRRKYVYQTRACSKSVLGG